MARRRKQLDFRALAEALTDPAPEPVSMAAIALRLGVAKPTLYRMAGSRRELIRLAVDAEAERLLERVHRDGLHGVFGFAADSPAGFLLLFGDRYPEGRQALRRVESRLALALAREDGLGAAEVAAAGLLGLAAGVVRAAIDAGGRIEVERLGSDFDAVAKIAARISDPAA